MRKLWAALIHLVLGIAVLALLADAVIVGLHYQSFGLIVLVGIAYRLCRRGWQVSGSYGTARLAGLNDLLAGNLLCDQGLILGRVGNAARPSKVQALGSLFAPRARSERAVRQFFAAFFRARRVDDFIRIRDFVHLATFAPAGAGKSTGVLVPNLLSYGVRPVNHIFTKIRGRARLLGASSSGSLRCRTPVPRLSPDRGERETGQTEGGARTQSPRARLS
jgi:Type IV secretory system Conjugative DNA transfer